jgi:membrane-bound lytic murein transglycosylase D
VVQTDVKFDRIAQVCNLTTDELRAINPQYRRDIVPLGHTLRLPLASIEPFITNEDSIYGRTAGGDIASLRRSVTEDIEQEPAPATRNRSRAGRSSNSGSRSATVRRGDTLSAIAKRHGTTVAKLRRLNGIRGSNIRAGQKLRVK